MSVLPLVGFYTVPEAVLPDQFNYGIGGGPHRSLGGYKSDTPLQHLQGPFEIIGSNRTDYTLSNPWVNLVLFRDITAAERTAGITLYRALHFQNLGTTAITNLRCYIEAPAVGTFTVQLATLTDGRSTPVANETTSPGGSFTAPSSGSPLTVSASLAANALCGLWLKLVIAAGAAAQGWNQAKVVFTGTDYDPKVFNLVHHLLAEQTISSVAGAGDSAKVRQQQGETFTITTTGAPANNLVYVDIVGGGPAVAYGAPLGTPLIQRQLDQCEYINSTTCKYKWRPPAPGFYTLRFFTAESAVLVERYVQH